MKDIAERIHYNATKHALDSVNKFGFYKCYKTEEIAKDIKELFGVDVKVGSGVLLQIETLDNEKQLTLF
jgi:hypothetical protein